ncbi:MAG: pyridoxal 5'-phosphate synthase glutaminase subunit PdxT [Halobacteriales archaeon]
MALRVGVVGVQGDVSEHVRALERFGERAARDVAVTVVRRAGVIPACDAVVLPGGESTTIARLVHDQGLATELVDHVEAGRALLATCAGLIVAARDPRDDRVRALGLLDVAVERNAFGRQRESFQVPLDVAGLDEPFPAVFIRAPVIVDAGSTEVLASVDGRPVAVRDGPVVGTAFHPELTGDDRLHRLALTGDVAPRRA